MKILFSIVLFLGLFQLANAQTLDNPGTPEERAEQMTIKMQEELDLSVGQVPEIKALNLKYAQIIQKEVIDAKLNTWAMYNHGTKINKKKEAELKPLLTENQWKKYEKLKSKAISQIWSKIF